MKHRITRRLNECPGCITGTRGLFSFLSKAELEIINQRKTCGLFRSGSIVYNEGLRINHLYCINEGKLKLYRTGISGKEQIIAFVKKGETVGYRSAFSGDISGHTARVIEDAHICVIPAEIILGFIHTNPSFSLHLIQYLCRELNRYGEHITDLAQKSVRERLAAVLIDLKETFGLDDQQNIQIALTREDLANLVGTATETIIRQLSEFKNDKFISLERRKIKILNHKALVKISHI